MDRLFGRVPYIERKNQELGGFPTLFARMSPEIREKVLSQISELEQKFGRGTPEFFEGVKALAEACGAIINGLEGKPAEERTSILTQRLKEIEKVRIELEEARAIAKPSSSLSA